MTPRSWVPTKTTQTKMTSTASELAQLASSRQRIPAHRSEPSPSLLNLRPAGRNNNVAGGWSSGKEKRRGGQVHSSIFGFCIRGADILKFLKFWSKIIKKISKITAEIISYQGGGLYNRAKIWTLVVAGCLAGVALAGGSTTYPNTQVTSMAHALHKRGRSARRSSGASIGQSSSMSWMAANGPNLLELIDGS